jgi:hypothetical protein
MFLLLSVFFGFLNPYYLHRYGNCDFIDFLEVRGYEVAPFTDEAVPVVIRFLELAATSGAAVDCHASSYRFIRATPFLSAVRLYTHTMRYAVLTMVSLILGVLSRKWLPPKRGVTFRRGFPWVHVVRL